MFFHCLQPYLLTIVNYHRAGIIAVCIEIWLWMVLNKKYGYATIFAASGGWIAILLYDSVVTLYAQIFEMVRGDVIISSDQFLRGRGMN